MAALSIEQFLLAITLGVLAAIVYSLRVLVLMESRVASMEMHIEKLTEKVLKEEIVIEKAVKHKKK